MTKEEKKRISEPSVAVDEKTLELIRKELERKAKAK